MLCTRVTRFPQLLAISTLVLLTFGESFSHARRVLLEVSTDGEFAVLHGGSSFSSQKENIVGGGDVPSGAAAAAAAVVKTYKIGGRRMSYDQKGQNTEAYSSALIHGVAGEERDQEHWKQVLMAFAADYTSPRAHPPSHN